MDQRINTQQASSLYDNINKSRSEDWNKPSPPNLTNLDVAPFLQTPESVRKSKSYFHSKTPVSNVKMDELWRFLYIQAESI